MDNIITNNIPYMTYNSYFATAPVLAFKMGDLKLVNKKRMNHNSSVKRWYRNM